MSDLQIFALGIYVVMCWFGGVIAVKRGRSLAAWFLLSFVITPVVVYVVLDLLEKHKQKNDGWTKRRVSEKQLQED